MTAWQHLTDVPKLITTLPLARLTRILKFAFVIIGYFAAGYFPVGRRCSHRLTDKIRQLRACAPIRSISRHKTSARSARLFPARPAEAKLNHRNQLHHLTNGISRLFRRPRSAPFPLAKARVSECRSYESQFRSVRAQAMRREPDPLPVSVWHGPTILLALRDRVGFPSQDGPILRHRVFAFVSTQRNPEH